MSVEASEPQRPGVRGWAVWTLPPRVLATVLFVEVVAVVLVVGGLARRPPPAPEELAAAAVLVLLGVVYTELSVGVERMRRRLVDANHVDLNSVWTFASVVVLTGPHAAVVAVVMLMHLWARAWRPSVPLYRHLFSVATVVLACLATGAFLERVGPPEYRLWVLLVAIGLYAAINTGLIAAVVRVSTPDVVPSALFGPWDENVLEIGMLCMGALTAIALVLNPWSVLLVLPPLFAVLRAVLVRPLEVAASTDGKTGLLNAAAWLAEAERVLLRPGATERAGGVLVLDLDHFKAVNDTYGHVVGDRVLAAFADALRRVVRAHDLVGRLGGEEFVVMPRRMAYGARSVELDAVELEVVAERIRARVADLRLTLPAADGARTVAGLTVSIGGAVLPANGSDLASLLQTADAALYAAKRAGRNTVCIEVAPVRR
ncbi:diguanylate cyclase [Pseudonocardia sichuanensis]